MSEEEPQFPGKRPQFGNRFLPQRADNDDDGDEAVFQHNAWDNVEWSEEQKQLAEEAVKKNGTIKFSKDELEQLDVSQATHWNEFYQMHQNKFFKDRHWLFTEFPELAPNVQAPERVYPESSDLVNKMSELHVNATTTGEGRKIFEIGSGVGNTVLPILKYSTEPNLMVYASDFSEQAIKILKENPVYNEKRCTAFVLDATADEWGEVPFEENSLDIIVMIFVLSAIGPSKYPKIVENIRKFLKPGGLLLFRDYGRFDMAQLRFKTGKCLQENFYLRGDGTRCYFFSQDDLRDLFTSRNFIEEYNMVDRRLQVNRGKMLKMYRIWIQCKYRRAD